jgi:hypothetical protein
MIFITNPFALPLLILIWSLDAWLWLASLRLILDKLPSVRINHFCQSLRQFTDPLPNAVNRWISLWTRKPIPTWFMWLLTLVAVIVLRHLLISFVMSMQSSSQGN